MVLSVKGNLTFRGGEPSWANACVGDNGSPDFFYYAKGYSSAANLLIRAALSDYSSKYPVDLFVYPICFNMRHSVELRLKGAFEALEKISEHRHPLPFFSLKGSHDIGRIWCYIKQESIRLDERFVFFTSFLDRYILDIAAVDATGQTFRYPNDSDNVKHLVEVDTINVGVLFRRFNALEKLLDNFESFCCEIVSEYDLKTYTTNLSRSQLFEIADLIPPESEWGSQQFKDLKNELKAKYGIGSKEFGDALCKIKGHYGAAPALEPPPLKFLTVDVLFCFFDAWCDLNDVELLRNRPKIETIDFSDDSQVISGFERIRERGLKEVEVWPVIKEKININQVAELKALFGSCDSQYSEVYVHCVEVEKEKFAACADVSKIIKHEVLRLLRNGQAFDYVLKVLYLIGHHKIAELIVERYKVGDCFEWLDAARNRRLFVEPYRRVFSQTLDAFVDDHEAGVE
jgi:hypothetical protein